MSIHTVIRPADEGMPTPSAEGFERRAVTCMVCLHTFTVWKWEGATVTLTHVGNGDTHIERHGPRKASMDAELDALHKEQDADFYSRSYPGGQAAT